jgi:hypothetical protein
MSAYRGKPKKLLNYLKKLLRLQATGGLPANPADACRGHGARLERLRQPCSDEFL